MQKKETLQELFCEESKKRQTEGFDKVLPVFFAALEEVRETLAQQQISFTVNLEPIDAGPGRHDHDNNRLEYYKGTIVIGEHHKLEVLCYRRTAHYQSESKIGIRVGSQFSDTVLDGNDAQDAFNGIQTYLITQASHIDLLSKLNPNATKMRHIKKRI